MSLAHRRAGQCIFCAFKNTPAWTLIGPVSCQTTRWRSDSKLSPTQKFKRRKREAIARTTLIAVNKTELYRKARWQTAKGSEGSSSLSVEDRRSKGSYDILLGIIHDQKDIALRSVEEEQKLSLGLESEKAFLQWRMAVEKRIDLACTPNPQSSKYDDELFHKFNVAFVSDGRKGVQREMRHMCQTLAFERFETRTGALEEIVNFTFPPISYPQTRQIQRKVHLHVGPTNSGKTYQALKRLENADTGLYAGPLRLLAAEVYTRMNARGKLCSLITGEEQKIPTGQTRTMSSCTVEMLPLNKIVDVAVIDEIQMLANRERGWAWTRAFFGVQARELHLCGELRTIQLVEKLCRMTGESLEIHTYDRLTGLEMEKGSLKADMKNLRKGDCIIAFSRVSLHAIKKEVEASTGKKCALIYGTLPSDIRTEQADLFNDPNNDYDFLAASDAVGMGLNLSIRRIIFRESAKFDGKSYGNIAASEIKQIAGRAGRYKTAAEGNAASIAERGAAQDAGSKGSQTEPAKPLKSQTKGWVTTFEDYDYPLIAKAMKETAPSLQAAHILPSDTEIMRFASYFPASTPLSYIIRRMRDLSTTGTHFAFTDLEEWMSAADAIQNVKLALKDRLKMICVPVGDEKTLQILRAYATCVADNKSGHILDIKELPLELLDLPLSNGNIKEDLLKIEVLHKALTMYLWVSYRWPGVFTSQALAFHIYKLCAAKIGEYLDHSRLVSWSDEQDRRLRRIQGVKRAEVIASKRKHLAWRMDRIGQKFRSLDLSRQLETQNDQNELTRE